MIFKKTFSVGLLLISFSVSAKVLVIGDSLAYPIAESLKKILPTDGYFLENTGLNKQLSFNWSEYIQTLNLKKYSNVIISLGANDGITKKEIDNYQQKAVNVIKIIQAGNDGALVTWVLPPVLKDCKKENAVSNVRGALNLACNASGITCFDPSVVIGSEFAMSVNGIPVRTKDGIHYTQRGADLIVNELLGIK
ncbi:Uncharacterised protein [Yersinia enterocolitica]|uniref:SGNH hydrolase-type esterase domain-containing protein n=1 Tax=Proteus terrae subsp. cibarius TaxID=626774 RepID=A0ABX6JT24_9GAMM|nr:MULTISPECIES: hypothetical protein [Enterobacterales]MBU5964348.1 hypothetical protein [Proteus mirabilis]QGW05308.1 hypothetical protein F9282_20135 [Proteus terrae subsp. cibarius]QHD96417.1 hypothetical protein GSM99_18630 [Proteus terrae subsp. cibarius]QIF92342.1 hypothetical protein GTH23_20075 [Proteus terrae subsp. cibarius]QJW53144.1 hypothetical protein HND96_19860 [Proteus terrae subsp. cibarius]